MLTSWSTHEDEKNTINELKNEKMKYILLEVMEEVHVKVFVKGETNVLLFDPIPKAQC